MEMFSSLVYCIPLHDVVEIIRRQLFNFSMHFLHDTCFVSKCKCTNFFQLGTPRNVLKPPPESCHVQQDMTWHISAHCICSAVKLKSQSPPDTHKNKVIGVLLSATQRM